MIIGVLGYSEKRHVIYPLLKLLSLYGKTALVTDNGKVRKLIEGYETTGYIGDAFICITNEALEDVFYTIEENAREFDFIIYDMNEDVPEGADLCILCDSGYYMEGEDILPEIVDDLKRVVMSGKKLKTTKADCVVPYTAKVFEYFEKVETSGILLKPDNKVLSRYLSNWLSPFLNHSANEVAKNLERSWK